MHECVCILCDDCDLPIFSFLKFNILFAHHSKQEQKTITKRKPNPNYNLRLHKIDNLVVDSHLDLFDVTSRLFFLLRCCRHNTAHHKTYEEVK